MKKIIKPLDSIKFSPRLIGGGICLAKKTSCLALMMVASLGASHFTQAASVYEGFNYTPGNNITSVSSTSTGLGSWSSYNAYIGTTNATGLTFGSLATSAGSLVVSNPTSNAWTFLTAPVTAGGAIADGATLWTSYLFQASAAGSASNFGLAVGINANDHAEAVMAQSYSGPNSARIAFADGTQNAFTTGGIFDGATHMFIGKWTNLGGASTATGWALSLADFNAITAVGPVTEVALNLHNQGTSSVVSATTASSFGTSQFVKIGGYFGVNSATDGYKVDEIRFDSTLAGVMPIPEPSTWALLALGLTTVVSLRRRQRI